MTDFKTILVPVTDGTLAASPLETAFQIAALSDAHVMGLHVRTDPTTAVPLVGEGMSGGMVEEMMSAAERQAAERAQQAQQAFTAICAAKAATLREAPGATGLTAQWFDVTGREEEIAIWRSRVADLMVMGRPADGADLASLVTLNAALIEGGKPLLLAPPDRPLSVGKRVCIAWNGSAEASRAVAAALPLLVRAQSVTILSVAENREGHSTPAAELSTFLGWHGIKTDIKTTPAGGQNAGQVLLQQCRNADADLLVMGAYTHSRLRQLILGGVTRYVLGHAHLACLLCH